MKYLIPDERPCLCGHVMTPGLRFEGVDILRVLICWRCGAEDPPYLTYASARADRLTATWGSA